jgi:uncharacterized membrane protein
MQSNIELSVNYFAADNLFDQNSVPPQLCFWFGWSTNLRMLDWPPLEGRIAINWICVLWSKQLHTLGLKELSQIRQPCTSPAFIFPKSHKKRQHDETLINPRSATHIPRSKTLKSEMTI